MWGQKKGMTKRIFIASMIALLCVMQSWAKEIKADEALARALSEMKYETQTRAAVGDYKLVRSEDHLYVFSTGNGFLLASADTALTPSWDIPTMERSTRFCSIRLSRNGSTNVNLH